MATSEIPSEDEELTIPKSAERALRRSNDRLEESEARYRLLTETSFDGIAISEGGIVTELNSGFAAIHGYAVEEMVGKSLFDFVSGESFEEVRNRITENIGGRYELVGLHRDGRKLRLEAIASTHDFRGRVRRVTALRDVTERHTLERQFQQAQKMEAIGRLAGGVAHDFNNLLTVISSYTNLVLAENVLPPTVRDDLQEVCKAAESAAGLTRQLLAFSRQQMLEPKALDLNDVVRDAEKMLRRVIGEDVRLITVLGSDLLRTQGDFGQIEQVIMNMAVNARDAMPGGGTLTIETANADLAEDFVLDHFVAKAGSYVLLSIRDTGTGMSEETKARIFEPFFTTKDPGRGTGLGLSMVYGIVLQAGGCVTVDSSPGLGTVFNIYLPRVDAVPVPEFAVAMREEAKGTETVLLVEDVPAVRDVVHRVLAGNGYTVLDAVDGPSALARAASHRGPLHLLLTDVVLPGLSGRELADKLKPSRPELKVLFTSGYTDDSVTRRGVFGRDAAFMQKPFTPETLARRVREVLD
jgi:two-component system, cell cycle sensor histidine kinase and response regulator CckA